MAGALNLDGLGLALERDEEIRADALEHKHLLKWPSVKKTGLINMQTMGLNSNVIMAVLKIWIPQLTDKLKTVNLIQVKGEARPASLRDYVRFISLNPQQKNR